MNDIELGIEMTAEAKAWQILLDDCDYRIEHPDDYHRTLVARADELRLRGLIDWEDWNALKELADTAYTHTVEARRAAP